MYGCRSAVPDTIVSHISLYMVMTKVGKVVQRSPYSQISETEKWEAVGDVENLGDRRNAVVGG